MVRFSGSGSRDTQTTADFTVGHVEWRIRWQYTPNPELASDAGLVVFTYPKGEPGNSINMILATGSSQTNGTSLVHNRTGTFYMTVAAPDAVLTYTLIVEQDLDSIPEFPTTLLLPLFLGATLLSAAIAKRKNAKNILAQPASPLRKS